MERRKKVIKKGSEEGRKEGETKVNEERRRKILKTRRSGDVFLSLPFKFIASFLYILTCAGEKESLYSLRH
jgi:hypothetical protein